MLGGMFAGHDEGKGKLIKHNGKKYIEFYGSSSNIANKKTLLCFLPIEVVKAELLK